ncbi:MAG: hypothetical protein HY763_14050 [Planctomycetes bacterium]|nr:hypothetical protein [Planctomycetota bacterium]
MLTCTGRWSRFVVGTTTLAAVALFVVHALALDYVVDDTYISLHYARNFAEGNGLVYNLGERVEGYTNFLWVLILGGIARLRPGVDLLAAARAISLVLGVATLVLAVVVGHRLHRRGGAWAALTALMLAANSSFCAWTMAGLESPLFTFLVLLSLFAHEREFRTGRGTFLAALAPTLAALTRADGFVVYAILSVARLHEHRRGGFPLLSRRTLVWLATFVAVIAPYVAWRMWYYGHPMPNTYYAKVGGGVDQLFRGVRHLKAFAEMYGGALLIPMVLLPLVRRQASPGQRGAYWMAAGWTAYIVQVGGDGLAYYRFFGFLMPVICLVAMAGVAELDAWARSNLGDVSPARLRIITTGLALALAALGAQQSNEVLRHPDPAVKPYHHFDNYFVDRCAAAGRWLAEHAPPEAVVASTPAGAVAYHSRRRIIDMLGLTDAHIARVPVPRMGRGRAGHEKGDGAYVLSRKPDYILLGNVAVGAEPATSEWMEENLCQRSEREIWKAPEFHAHYELRTVALTASGPFRYFSFYQRKP